MLIFGSLSIILKILPAADLPYVIFFKAGGSWLKLNPTIIILKKTVNTIPAVYYCRAIKLGHLYVVSIQWAPYQNPNEYAVNIAKKAAPKLNPAKAPNAAVPFPAYSRHSSYLYDSNAYPLSILTVLIEDNDC